MTRLDPSVLEFLRSMQLGANSPVAKSLIADDICSMEQLLVCREAELLLYGFTKGQVLTLRQRKQEMIASSPPPPMRASSDGAIVLRPRTPERSPAPSPARPVAQPLLRLSQVKLVPAYTTSQTQNRALLLDRALGKIAGGASLRKAALDTGVALSTLQAHASGTSKVVGRGAPSALSADQEELVVSWADTASVMGWEVTRSILSQRVIELKPTLKCSERWWSAFLRRNPNLQRKKNVGMEGPRASALNAPNITRWTTLLAETIDRLKISASQIFNMDETGFSFDLVRYIFNLIYGLLRDIFEKFVSFIHKMFINKLTESTPYRPVATLTAESKPSRLRLCPRSASTSPWHALSVPTESLCRRSSSSPRRETRRGTSGCRGSTKR